jgi:hypothetical protein
LLLLAHQHKIIGFAHTPWKLSESESVVMPIPGIYRIHWKNTAYTYQLIDYQTKDESFIFRRFDENRTLALFLGVYFDGMHGQSTKRMQWFKCVFDILSGPGKFLLEASRPKEGQERLTELIASLVG